MPKAPKRKGKLATALAGQQLAQQQRQAEERARQAQEDRDKAKALKANASRSKSSASSVSSTATPHSAVATDAPASSKGKKRARQDDVDDNEETAERPRQDGGVQPFKKGERILLVGEGNFSFAHALLGPSNSPTTEPSSSASASPKPPTPGQPLVTPSLLLCTAFDSEPVAAQKYPDLSVHVDALRSAGATVLFGVDATNLATSKQVREFAAFGPNGPVRGAKKKERRRVKGKGRMLDGWASRADKLEKDARMLDGDDDLDEDRQVGFDKIVFNFPHVGQGITDQARNVRANQTLLLDFYRSAAPFLRTGKPHSLSTASASARRTQVHRHAGSDSEGELDLLDEQAGPDAESGLLGDASMQAGITTAPTAGTGVGAVMGPLPPHRGTILLTLRTNGPYASWLPAQLATKPSLLLPSILPVHELKLRSTPQRGGPQPPYRTVRSWKFDTKRWEELGYEHRRTVGYEEKFAELDGGKNADLAMTAKERKQRRLEAVAATAAGGGGGDKGAAASSSSSQQHDIRTWEFELVAEEDDLSSTKRGGGNAAAAAATSGRGGKKGRAGGKGRKFEVGGADDPDLMSD